MKSGTIRVLLLGAILIVGCGGTTTKTVTQPAASQRPSAPIVKPALRVATVPPTADTEARTDGLVEAGGARCGRERWDVKTATDPMAGSINLTPRETTVQALDQLASTNPGNPDQPRGSGVESTVYKLSATLQVAKREADSDFHLALSDGAGHTMIAEIPNAPACTEPPVTRGVSPLETQIEQARTQFVQAFGEPPSRGWETIDKQVTLVGVGFFDILHGQRNVAPQGIELHPVLSINVGASQ